MSQSLPQNTFSKKQEVRTKVLNLDDNEFLKLHHDAYNCRAIGVNGKLKYDEQFPPETYFAPQTIVRLMPELQKSRTLDLGCGNGRIATEMSKMGIVPTYIDGVDAALKMLEQAVNTGYRKLILADITDKRRWEKNLGTYSCIVSSCLFGHIIGRRHGIEGHISATNVLISYLHHLTPKASIGLTLGNVRGSGSTDEQSTLYKMVIAQLQKNGFNDIQMDHLPGHIDPDVFRRNKVNYIYVIARRH